MSRAEFEREMLVRPIRREGFRKLGALAKRIEHRWRFRLAHDVVTRYHPLEWGESLFVHVLTSER